MGQDGVCRFNQHLVELTQLISNRRNTTHKKPKLPKSHFMRHSALMIE
jgi:hypothetical protein